MQDANEKGELYLVLQGEAHQPIEGIDHAIEINTLYSRSVLTPTGPWHARGPPLTQRSSSDLPWLVRRLFVLAPGRTKLFHIG